MHNSGVETALRELAGAVRQAKKDLAHLHYRITLTETFSEEEVEACYLFLHKLCQEMADIQRGMTASQLFFSSKRAG